jgi:hypothetical protein
MIYCSEIHTLNPIRTPVAAPAGVFLFLKLWKIFPLPVPVASIQGPTTSKSSEAFTAPAIARNVGRGLSTYLRSKTGQRIVFFFEEVSDINSLF